MKFSIRLLFVCGLLCVLTVIARADNWPQWRGPTNDGISKEKGLPVKWSERDNVAWKLTMPGIGSSTPAIWGDRIFLTAVEDKSVVLCCISTDGKMMWKRPFASGARAGGGRGEGNDASASPST